MLLASLKTTQDKAKSEHQPGSHKRPQRGYYEAAGVAVYLDETRLVPPEPIMEGGGGDLNLGSDR